MLDACPHHHEDAIEITPPVDPSGSDLSASDLSGSDLMDGVSLRSPGQSKPTGKKYWRDLNELANTQSFQNLVHREFPHAASEWNDDPSRRNFLKLMGASLALAGVSGCVLRKPEEKIVPYVNPPEEVIPGRPLFFASTMPFAGYGKGVVVESHEGRPTKIEGNTDHPASLGASDVWMQASVLELYDPDRSQTVRRANSLGGDDISSWSAFVLTMTAEIQKKQATRGAGLRFLTGAVTSPTMVRQMAELMKALPLAKWHQYEPVGRRNAKVGAIKAFGRDVETIYAFAKADVVSALDSNFLLEQPGSIAYARQFIDRRRIRLNMDGAANGEATMNRLYVAESTVTLTGAQADHRLAIKSGDIEALARKIAAAVGGTAATGDNAKWINALAKDLTAAKGRSLVIAGETQPPAVHALAHAMNDALGNVGAAVFYTDPVEVGTDQTLETLIADIELNIVDALFIMGTNPVYTAPPELKLAKGLNGPTLDDRTADFNENPLKKVRLVVHHGLYSRENDETANFAHWHIPASHYLESWGDLRAFDGTASIIQPLIYPLYTTKTEIELVGSLLSILRKEEETAGHGWVRDTWVAGGPKLSEDDWQRVLEKGVIPGSASAAVSVSLKAKLADYPVLPTPQPVAGVPIEIVFRPDPSVYDGRYGNSGWLQEVPKPLSLLTWENVALMSIATAERLNVKQLDEGRGCEVPVMKIEYNGRFMTIPALIMPGHAENSATVYLGYGRTRGGRVAHAIGTDAYAVRPAADTWILSGADVSLQDERTLVATSQSHHLIDLSDSDKGKLDSNWLHDREIIQNFDLKDLEKAKKADPNGRPYRKISLEIHGEPTPKSEMLIPSRDYDHRDSNNGNPDPTYNKWGMVIDNQACIGCNACVVACQSENNIAIVGKEQVLKGRIMQWLRIDTYFEGEPDGSPDVTFQPLPCMNCENAPCTLVCPVEATTISAEGINEMTYNRCVGTRYCSNNCPYKVRRFNFLQYTDYETPQVQLQRNPNVTVRSRGVMEKCNYCVQRVNNSRIEAKKQDRPIAPGDVVTACAQACPTQAIFFGNLNDDRWEVTKLQKEPLRYTLLDELNTLPRTSYLSRVRNPNPELAMAEPKETTE